MSDSTKIAQLAGPLIVAVIATENPFVNPYLYDAQIPPVVYLNGTLFFLGGLSIARVHNFWRRDWTTLVTLVGWTAMALGLIRMTFPHAHVENVDANSLPILVVEFVLLIVGIFLTYKGYFSKGDGVDNDN